MGKKAKKTKRPPGEKWEWPWPEEDEDVWGKDIIDKYGELTDLDRRLHGKLKLEEEGKTSNAMQGRWVIESTQLQLAMRRRDGVEPVAADEIDSSPSPATDAAAGSGGGKSKKKKKPSSSEGSPAAVAVDGGAPISVGSAGYPQAASVTKAAAKPAAKAAAKAGPPSLIEASTDRSFETLKEEGNALYLKNDHAGAIVKYGAAIDALQKIVGEEPEAAADRKVLAILFTNRATAALAIVRASKKGGTSGAQPGGCMNLPKDLRKQAMMANADASEAVELDETNAKAWLRKGQAMLSMSTLAQRAKEACKCLEKAKAGNLPQSLRPELDQSLKLGWQIFDKETPMPENCPQM